MARPPSEPIEDEASLAARAAWLYFSGGLTQAEIARRLQVPAGKAHRLVARASRDGLVRVFVDASVSECVRLEEELSARYRLDHCRVAPDLGETPLPLKALGIAGATYLKAAIERGEPVIGVGNGRTLAAAVARLPAVPGRGTRFVSVIGGLTRKFAANPFDVIHRLGEKTGCEAYLMPAPIFANSHADREVLKAQLGIAEVMALAETASPILAGIGELTDESFLVGSGMISREERAELKRAGAAGEILGHFFDRDGNAVAKDLTARALSPDLAVLAKNRLAGIAGGATKVAAIRAVLESGIVNELITDETTAAALAATAESRPRRSGGPRSRTTPSPPAAAEVA